MMLRAMILTTALREIPQEILAGGKLAVASPGLRLSWMGRQRSPESLACGPPLNGCLRTCSRH